MYLWDVDVRRDSHVNGENSLHSGLAWASDGNDIVPEKGHLLGDGRTCWMLDEALITAG
jgi:hypothetical protein